MKIVEAQEYSDDLLKSINMLLPQLSSSAHALTETELKTIISCESVHLFLAKDESVCLGTLLLAVFPTITGTRSWIEDVVVADRARGKGVGKALVEYAKSVARSHGVKTVDLTSRPSRVAANELYKKTGFVVRDTNVYRYSE